MLKNIFIKKYLENTPSFFYITNKYFNNNYNIDHLAHRSIDWSFLKNYYNKSNFEQQNDIYNFPRYNVKATWFKSEEFRIFLSQYQGNKIPVIKNFNDYLILSEKNQYLAWTLLHSHDINHLAISVKNIENFFEILKNDNKITLATGLQISQDKKLKQFSIQADKIKYNFQDNSVNIVPYSFVEFIERIDNREGFDNENADKILDSTK